MKSIGGNSANYLVQKIIGSMIHDEVLRDYSFMGQKTLASGEKNKKFSELTFCSVLYREFSFCM